MHGQPTNPLHAIKARSTTLRSAFIAADKDRSNTVDGNGRAIFDANRRGAGVRPLALKAGAK